MSDSALSVSVILSSDSALLVSVSVMLCQTVLYRYQWYYHLTVLYLYQYLWCYVRQCSISISDTIIWQCSTCISICDAMSDSALSVSVILSSDCSTCISICDAMSDSALSVSVILSFDSAHLYQYLWCYVRQCSISISDTIIWQCSNCICICDAMSDSALSVSVILSFDSALLVSVSVMLCQTVLYRYQWYYHLTVLYLYQYLWCYVRQCSIGISDTIIWQCSTCISICDAMSDSALSVSVILSFDSALLVSVSVMLCQTVLYQYQWYYHLTALLVSVSVILSSDCSISITISICISIIFDSFIHPKEGSSTSVWALSMYSDSSPPHFGGVQSSCSSKKIFFDCNVHLP